MPTVPGAGGRVLGRTVRVGPLSQIPRVLTDLGFEPGPILREAGFAPAFFDDPELPIPYVAGGRLLAHCVTVTGCESFGLMVGELGGPSSLGLAGFLMMNAPDVGTALRDLVTYLRVHDRGGVASLQVGRDTAFLGFTVVEPQTPSPEQVYDLSIAIARNLMRSLCGADWNPTEVLLPRRRPADPLPWHRYFQAHVQFDAGQAALTFPTRWLSHPVRLADPLLRRLLRQQADAMGDRSGFLDEVRRIVSGTVALDASTAANVAALLGMSERSLNRRLLEAGMPFRRLRDDVRYGMSRELLGNTSMNLTQIAASLGYAEASAFVRAFTRWSGATPHRWRTARRHGRRAGSSR